MTALTANEKLVLELLNGMSPERRRVLLYELAKDAEAAWQRNTAYAERRLRQRARERGVEWDKLDDRQRQEFVRALLDEDD